jgi:hypothetical protein
MLKSTSACLCLAAVLTGCPDEYRRRGRAAYGERRTEGADRNRGDRAEEHRVDDGFEGQKRR